MPELVLERARNALTEVEAMCVADELCDRSINVIIADAKHIIVSVDNLVISNKPPTNKNEQENWTFFSQVVCRCKIRNEPICHIKGDACPQKVDTRLGRCWVTVEAQSAPANL